MKYISSRGEIKPIGFVESVTEGLARDGGLLIPEYFPNVTDRLEYWASLSYCQLASEIFQLFIEDELNKSTIESLVSKAYKSFTAAEVTPLSFVDTLGILELYHGPTLAFKDIALQFLGNLFEEILKRNGGKLNILGATSGDTGSAAIHGVRNKENINIFMLHPYGKVSPVQEKQMTTVLDDNVFNLAIEGTFDDAQRAVKTIFNDLNFRDRYSLGAVNSINWARVMAQIVYYFYASFRYRERFDVENVCFSVPTGNFGDIYAGYVALKMGAPIQKLILATNENDILYRTIQSGSYEIKDVHATLSPSMDIQVASNFERFLFDICGRDGSKIKIKMNSLSTDGQFSLDDKELQAAKEYFIPLRIDTQRTLQIMRDFKAKGIDLDPHTAVGVAAAEDSGNKNVIALATAHPAKFGDAVVKATGHSPLVPNSLQEINEMPTKCERIKNDHFAVQRYIEECLDS